MDTDIHSPSVPHHSASSPTSTNISTSTASDENRVSLLELIKQKDSLEAELKALGSVLDSHGVKMTTSLTSFDGYPRDDIDVYQIRTTRAKIIHLRNDYKELMSRIEKGLHELHASQSKITSSAPESTPVSASVPSAASASTTSTTKIPTPFAKINSVSATSPADEGGLKVGDYIKRFGDVNALNHEKLKKLSALVSTSEGKSIVVLVSRKVDGDTGVSEDIELTIVPKIWAGPGKLGCHILPL